MLAVIKTGGKQYKIKEGDIIEVEKIQGKKGDNIFINEVLLLADEKFVKIGNPYVKNCKVRCKILDQIKSDKILVVKYKPKTRYRRKKGHRQFITKLKIEKIEFK